MCSDMTVLDNLPVSYEEWRKAYGLTPERDAPFTTLSGEDDQPALHRARSPADREASIGLPGQYPFTRGVYPSMYRGRLWTMRQFAGFGTAAETNKRFHYLLEHGQTGLSTAFDMPSLMGHDSDHPRSLGEVGREGVAIDTVIDMETLFGGIPLDEVTVSMTINAPAAIMLAFYVVAAERQGDRLRAAGRDDPDRHPQGVHRPEGVVLPGRSGDAPGHRHDRVVLGAHAALASDQHLRLPHPRGRLDRGPGARLHSQGRADLRRAGGGPRPRRRRLRARGCRSSSTPRSTSSRRSPSTGRRGGSGPASCARRSARARPSRGGCASTPRRRGCR